MTIDNFENIKSLLNFGDDGDTFYFLQIMQRKKDGADIIKDNRIINNYYITSWEYFEDRWEEIKTLCHLFHARAYISINPGSFKKCCLYGMKELADINISGNYRSVLNLAPTLAGKYSGNSNKYWIIDFDNKDGSYEALQGFIRNKNGKDGRGIDKIVKVLPTKNGLHLICTPFDPSGFDKFCKENFNFEVGIHKNSPTLLYYSDEHSLKI